MSQINPPLVGSVIERKPTSKFAPKSFIPAKTGFPEVQHRSKSAFARNIDNLRKTESYRPRNVPVIVPSGPTRLPGPTDPDDWRERIGRENEERVASMTEEEREQERQEILDRFGAGVSDLLKRVRLAREKQAKSVQGNNDSSMVNIQRQNSDLEPVPVTAREDIEREVTISRLSTPPPALSTSSTRPSSRADRRLRFAELGPGDIHVYESAPPSPRRKALALPPPSNDGSAISLGQYSGCSAPPVPTPATASQSQKVDTEPEEGSAEYIRRRYFPNAPANDPSIAWMQVKQPFDSHANPALRFDLSGKPIPPSASSILPMHLGLHHHAEGTHAGYTLDDMFLLSRSTVPAQRATMLAVLAKVAKRVAAMLKGETDGVEELVGQEEELRKRIMAAGAEALLERGSVGARAVEVIWQCIVGWDEEITTIEGVESESPSDTAFGSLRLDFFLPQIATLLSQSDISEETKLQILGILLRLGQHSNSFATSIVNTSRLIPSILHSFLLTPIPPTDTTPLPDPRAIELLLVLASASRKNASALQGFADDLLRFISFIPSSSLYPPALSISLSTATLRFYTVLANYGLYSHIATTAMEQLTQLGQYILSDECSSIALAVAWTDLLAAWMVCALDPHQTTPDHEILWSQIIGWGWSSEVNNLSDRLGTEQKHWAIWAGVWKVHAVWLEGAKVNGIRGGSSERMECIDVIRDGFTEGIEKEVIIGCLDAIKQSMNQLNSLLPGQSQLPHLRAIKGHANTLSAAIRLWLACLPPLSDGPLDSPPFPLPVPRISDLCAMISVHPSWSLLDSNDRGMHSAYVYLRSLSELLSNYLRLSRRLPTTSKEQWMAQALSILLKLLPGDEDFALEVINDISSLITPEWLQSLGIPAPPVIWDRGGIDVIKPFLVHTLRPHHDVYIGPTSPTPQSISTATTQRLPSIIALRTFGLPLLREWTLSPLDHLLHSGTSEVFKALPVGWDASEVEIVRTSLLLTGLCRDILHHYSLTNFVLTREEAVFGCMKVFMLEHGQTQTTDSKEEVFRDQIVDRFMADILRPYTVHTTLSRSSGPVIPTPAHPDLEQVATKFLGNTPFYQYYTDFVALYDAISFSHPLFASLLLPPTSMRYPLDYRKHLWNDFGHILKTIRTPVEQVLCEDLKEYLWPIEGDPQMIGFYLRTLLKQQLQGFVHLVALHHVASSIWVDISAKSSWAEERASKLLVAIVDQGNPELIREVVQYRQNDTGPTLLPPECFDLVSIGHQVKISRLQFVTGLGLQDRLQGLFSMS